MEGKITLTILKPDAVKAGNSGAIIKMIQEAGFSVRAMKLIRLSNERAGQFYLVHQERPFYTDLCKYMSSGPIVPMILEKENAIEVEVNSFIKLVQSRLNVQQALIWR